MTKRIKHVSDLPVWFDLKNYEFTKTLDSLGWFKLITREVQLLKSSKVSTHLNHELTSKKFTPLTRKTPNLFIEDHSALSLFTGFHCDSYLNAKTVKSTRGLHRLDYNFSDAFLIENFKQF